MAWWNPLSNPLEWLVGLSELGSFYGRHQQQREADRAYQRQRADYQRRMESLAEMSRVAREPISAEPYYKAMTDVERAATERQIKADLVSRNIPLDSAYATALAAERMGATETDRYRSALDVGRGHRGQVLGALGQQAGFPYSPERARMPSLGIPGAALRHYMLLKAIGRAREPERGRQATPPATAPFRQDYGVFEEDPFGGGGDMFQYETPSPSATYYPWTDPQGAGLPSEIPDLSWKYTGG